MSVMPPPPRNRGFLSSLGIERSAVAMGVGLCVMTFMLLSVLGRPTVSPPDETDAVAPPTVVEPSETDIAGQSAGAA